MRKLAKLKEARGTTDDHHDDSDDEVESHEGQAGVAQVVADDDDGDHDEEMDDGDEETVDEEEMSDGDEEMRDSTIPPSPVTSKQATAKEISKAGKSGGQDALEEAEKKAPAASVLVLPAVEEEPPLADKPLKESAPAEKMEEKAAESFSNPKDPVVEVKEVEVTKESNETVGRDDDAENA